MFGKHYALWISEETPNMFVCHVICWWYKGVCGVWLPSTCWKYTKFIIYCDKIGWKMLVTFETVYNEVSLAEHTCDKRDIPWSEKK